MASGAGWLQPAFGDHEVPLLQMTSDYPVTHTRLSLVVDDYSNIVSFRYTDQDQKSEDFPMAGLDDFITLYKSQGYDIFKLGSSAFSSAQGGALHFVYLHNGLSRDYHSFEVRLVRSGDVWSLEFQGARGTVKFNTFEFEMNRIMGQVVGIKAIKLGTSSWVDQNQTQTEVKILHITSDAMSGYGEMSVMQDANGHFLALRYRSNGGTPHDFTQMDLASGSVLMNRENVDIIKLETTQFNSSTGGVIDLVYTTNALFNTQESVGMKLVHEAGQWKLQTNDGANSKDYSNMFLEGNFWFGKIVGISKVTVH